LFLGAGKLLEKGFSAWKGAKNVDEVAEVVAKSGDEVPIYELSRSNFEDHVKMVENAQKEGHSLKNLKRGKGTKAARKNRYQAQKEIRKKQGGPKKDHDYDEFPYASTEQGGLGSHIEEVSSEVNQAAGRDLGKFYRENNIKHGDVFDIKIVD